MVYKNGLPFPHRPHRSKIPHYKHKYLHAVQAVERRISDAIDSGYVIDDFYNSYEIIARKILGYNPQPKIPYRIVPSAMESYSSCLRDPAFYRLCERISYFYYQYKSHLNPYHKDEVIYPGLKFESVDVDRLVTYFDDFDATISNGLAVTSQKEAETLLLKVRQFRLNHKPFTVNFTLNSDIVQKVAIQMFLGPKYDAQHNLLDFTDSYKYFYEIDYWITVVDAGSNKLERNSHDFFFVRPDDEPSEIFYKRIEEALEGTEKLTYKPNIYGFPDRLLLPKGHLGGSPYQLFVFVSPRKNPILWLSQPFRNYEVDYHAMGYPLDRPIYRPHFDGPNIFFKDVNIFFESDVHPNSTS
ncbi:hypothetical protein PV327_011244 [Microctonus hyperodae]|uniref:Uncharacterized protein n=1 Tax=Microctonus hyperodae TaxID=165561 RepID=A0AA39C542_MICHY|nr:hypothetical protein PV327_011244 [Microctonus hyperodae]